MTELGSEAQEQTRTVDLLRIIRMIWKKKALIASISLLFLIMGLVAAFVWPRTFRAEATVFPVTSGGNGLSQYVGLASMAGITLPDASAGADPAKTVGALLSSRLLAENLANETDLIGWFQRARPTELPETTDRSVLSQRVSGELKRAIESETDPKTGVMTISVDWEDPVKAQELCNKLIEVLDRLLEEKSLTSNKKKAEALDRQIVAQEEKVSALQRRMASFQRTTSMLNPSSQASKAVDSYVQMIEQKMNLELQIATAESSYSSENPKLSILKNQLQNLENQITQVKTQVDGDLPSLKSAPDTLIEYQNLTRDLEIATKVYAGLLAGMEEVKLQNDKEQVYIEVLDQALLPTVGKPSGIVIVLVSLILGVFLSVSFVLIDNLVRTLVSQSQIEKRNG